jgi:O-antigen/teichoic acid export membrane protein
MPSSSAGSPESSQSQRFFINVLWNWLSVGANIFTAIFLTRYLIRKLGDQRYGIWAIVFALIEYIFLFDLGFRSAIVNFVSRFRVQHDNDGINEVINTALFYFACVAVLVVGLTLAFSGQGYRFFKIAPEDRADFAFLLTLMGFTWAVGIISNIFQASLEAFQQFKSYNHIFIVMMVLRATGCAVLLYLGHGLRALGLVVVSAQFLGYILMFITFRRAFAELRFSRRFVRVERWKEMARYGVNSVIASSGSLFLNQGPPLLIGHYLPTAFAGYYSVPFRLLNYGVEMIARIGFVTVPKTAELYALGRTDQIIKLGTYINRYSLALFMPVSVYMVVFGSELIHRWLGPVFGLQSGPLLAIFAVSIALAVAGQFNSSQILFGMAKHGPYALSIVVESLLALLGMALVLPHYGILGAACVAASLSVLNRGLITPWIVCRRLGCGYLGYMAGIYVRPLLSAVPVAALALWIKSYWFAGETWIELVTAAILIALTGYLLCLFTCIDAEHRVMFRDTLLRKFRQHHTQEATA